MELLGRHHPLLRRLRALVRDAGRREAERAFVAEGLHLVAEAVARGAPIEFVVLDARLRHVAAGSVLLARLERAALPTFEVAESVMERVQDARAPQSVVAVVRRAPEGLDALMDRGGAAPLLVVADGVQDPGNLGALVRTAHAAGASAVLATGASVDPYHPRAVRASMGSVFELAPLRIAAAPLFERLVARGVRCVGTAPRGGADPRAYDLRGATALFFGSEAAGLDGGLAPRMERMLSVPMCAGVESLSVGAAAAVVLFEAAAQRGRDTPEVVASA